MRLTIASVLMVELQFYIHISALQPRPNNVAFKQRTINANPDFKVLTKCTTYVDKTMMIADFFKSCAPRDYQLITCPQKFGKTVNLDMLKSFASKNADYEFFRKFKIGPLLTNETDFYKNHFKKYNTVHLNFKVTGAKTYLEMFNRLSENFQCFSPLEKLLEKMSITEGKWNPNTQDCLMEYYYPNSNTFLFIDDYDSPIINAIEYNMDVTQVMQLIDNILFALFNARDHRNIQHALLTGTLNILDYKKFGTFKHWNFLADHRFVQYFGFTENEVDKLLDSHGFTKKDKQTMKQFYKGYNSSSTSMHIYDPFSITSFLADKELNNSNRALRNDRNESGLISNFVQTFKKYANSVARFLPNRESNNVHQNLKNYWTETSSISKFLQAFRKFEKLRELMEELLTLKKITFNMKKIWNAEDLEELKMMTHINVTEMTGYRVDLILSYLFYHGYLTHSDQANVYVMLHEDELKNFMDKSNVIKIDDTAKLVQFANIVRDKNDVLEKHEIKKKLFCD